MPTICRKTEVAFVDPCVDDLTNLLAGLRPEVEAVVLDAARPAAGQIAASLAGRTADHVHLISHGGPGVVAFTGGALSVESIHQFAGDLSAIGAALGNQGGLSLWSCRTAEGERGSAFVAALARATGVAVAASDQPVGSAAKGGTWTLTGGAEPAQPPLRAPVLETYEGVMGLLASTDIDGINDDNGVSSSDGITSDNTVELYGSANRNNGGGTFYLFISGTGFSGGANGQLVQTFSYPNAGNSPWSFTTGALANGTYTAYLSTSSTASAADFDSYTFTVDAAAPNAPTITSYTDNVAGGIVGVVPHLGLTNDDDPVIRVSLSGTGATNDDYLRLYDGATQVANIDLSSTNISNGYVDIALSNLSNSTHNFTARVYDEAGNLSNASATYTVTVDDSAPNITSGDGPYDRDEGVSTATVVYTATATGGPVTWSLGGLDGGDFTIDASGQVRFAVSPNYEAPADSNGNNLYTFDVIATDAAGNSDSQQVQIDVRNLNEAPDLDPETGTEVNYTTIIDPPVAIMGGGTIFDPDNPSNFDGGSLTFTITDAKAGDRLNFRNVEGLSVDFVLVFGFIPAYVVRDGGNIFAWITAGGVGSGDTTVTFSFTDFFSAATDGRVEKLLHNLGFSTTSTNTDDRHVSVTFNDGGNDGAGGSQSDTSVITINVALGDTTPTDAPSVIGYEDDVAPVTGLNFVSGSTTNDTTPLVQVSIAGTGAVEGDTVKLYQDGVLVASGVLGAANILAGGVSLGVSGLVNGGSYNFTATITDQANNVSDASAAFNLKVDTVAPVFTGGASQAVSFAENTPDTTVVFNAAADSDLGVTYSISGADAGKFNINSTTGEVRFNASPNFEAPTDTGTNNVYDLVIRATDAAGNFTNQSLAVTVTDVEEAPTDITLSGNTIVEHQPVGTVIAQLGGVDQDSGETFTFALTNTLGVPNQNGQFSIVGNQLRSNAVFDYDTRSSFQVEITVTDSSGKTYVELVPVEVVDPYEPVITINPLGPTNDTTPTISGTADEPGRTINLYEGDFLLGSTTIAANGTWSITTLPISLNGDRTVTARVVDKAGNVGEAQMTFVLDTIAPVVTIDNPGGPTNDSTQTLTGTAEPNDEVVIYDNGVQIGTTMTNGAGDWSFDVTVGYGGHSYVATQTDAAGNTGQSNGGLGLDFVLDTTPPAVAITSAGGPTNDGAPDIVGTAEAGATIEVYVNGALTETTTADGSGNWSVTNSALQDGGNTVQAKAIDAAGNSANSNTVAFTLDTDVPVVAISTASKGVNNANQLIQGSGTVGATVYVYDDGVLAGSTTVGANGLWSAAIGLNAQGANVVTAQAEDSAGNDSAVSNAVTLTLDSIAPAVAITSVGGDVLQASQIIQGTAEIGALVQLRENGSVVGSAVANAAGEWSITVNLGAVGESTFSATATDAAGNVGNGGAVTYDLQLTPGGGGGLADDLTVAEAFLAIMREPVAGEWVPYVNALQAKVDIGQIAIEDAVNQIIDEADDTTSVATLSYQFFTGEVPTAAGLDFLVSPVGPNANSLNDAYYQNFNIENRYINFAVNLGVVGEGNDEFEAGYGGLTLDQATAKAYEEIFGTAANQAKVDAILDAMVTSNGETMTRAEYFEFYGGDGLNGLGTKAAMVGWLLAEAAKADTGVYAEVNELFLFDIADGGTFNVDIVGVYGGLIDG